MSTLFLFILLHLLQTSAVRHNGCPSLLQKGLTCYSDYNHNITCIWKSSSVSDQENHTCSIYAERVDKARISYKSKYKYSYNASCQLQSFDSATPALKKCLLSFNGTYLFFSQNEVSLNMSCFPSKQTEIIFYKPACQIKVNPPRKPEVNFTALSWFSQVSEHKKIKRFNTQLQWKQKEQRWSDLLTKNVPCGWECEAQLERNSLLKGETYEARVRVLALEPIEGTWSDWSPTASWVSRVGKTKPGSGNDVVVLNWSILGLAVFGVLLLPGAFFTMYKGTCSRTYILKKITGPPLPNPAKATQFQTWLNPHFTSESYHSFLNSVNIVSVEVTSAVDAVVFSKPDVKEIPEINKYESSCGSFSNPSYSGLISSFVIPLTAGSTESCVSKKDGCVHQEEQNEKQDSDVAKKELEMVKLLLMGRINSEAVVISDYKKTDNLQAELHRLHSADSGMSSFEEVSQESTEADGIIMTDEGTPCEDEKQEVHNEGNETKSDLQKLFEDSGWTLDKNSILSPYKQIPMIQAENAELLRLFSVDSGISSYEEVSQESMDEDSIYTTEGHNEGTVSN